MAFICIIFWLSSILYYHILFPTPTLHLPLQLTWSLLERRVIPIESVNKDFIVNATRTGRLWGHQVIKYKLKENKSTNKNLHPEFCYWKMSIENLGWVNALSSDGKLRVWFITNFSPREMLVAEFQTKKRYSGGIPKPWTIKYYQQENSDLAGINWLLLN